MEAAVTSSPLASRILYPESESATKDRIGTLWDGVEELRDEQKQKKEKRDELNRKREEVTNRKTPCEAGIEEQNNQAKGRR